MSTLNSNIDHHDKNIENKILNIIKKNSNKYFYPDFKAIISNKSNIIYYDAGECCNLYVLPNNNPIPGNLAKLEIFGSDIIHIYFLCKSIYCIPITHSNNIEKIYIMRFENDGVIHVKLIILNTFPTVHCLDKASAIDIISKKL